MDILQRKGNYPVPPGASDILGVEFSGTVSTLGEGVTKFKANDEVFGIAGGVRTILLFVRHQLKLIQNGLCRVLMPSTLRYKKLISF